MISPSLSDVAAHGMALPVAVHASTPGQLQEDLSAAVSLIRDRAIEEGRHGILITQHSYTEFTVTISEDVPYGMTMEARPDRRSLASDGSTVDGRQ